MLSSNVGSIIGMHWTLATGFCFFPQRVIKCHTHFYLSLLQSGYLGMFSPFIPVQSCTEIREINRKLQCQTHSDLLITDACRNIIIIKSLSSCLTLTVIKLQLEVYSSATVSTKCNLLLHRLYKFC